MTERETIYVYLMDEATDAWRPVDTRPLGNNLYRIISHNTSEGDESWQFQTGAFVRAEYKDLSDGTVLVAVEAVE